VHTWQAGNLMLCFVARVDAMLRQGRSKDRRDAALQLCWVEMPPHYAAIGG